MIALLFTEIPQISPFFSLISIFCLCFTFRQSSASSFHLSPIGILTLLNKECTYLLHSRAFRSPGSGAGTPPGVYTISPERSRFTQARLPRHLLLQLLTIMSYVLFLYQTANFAAAKIPSTDFRTNCFYASMLSLAIKISSLSGFPAVTIFFHSPVPGNLLPFCALFSVASAGAIPSPPSTRRARKEAVPEPPPGPEARRSQFPACGARCPHPGCPAGTAPRPARPLNLPSELLGERRLGHAGARDCSDSPAVRVVPQPAPSPLPKSHRLNSPCSLPVTSHSSNSPSLLTSTYSVQPRKNQTPQKKYWKRRDEMHRPYNQNGAQSIRPDSLQTRVGAFGGKRLPQS